MSRDRIVDVAYAQRQAIERANAADPPLTAHQYRVLMCVFTLVTTWSRLADLVTLEQLAECSGVHRRTVQRSLRRLVELDVVIWVPGGRRRGERSTLGLPSASQAETDKGGRPSQVRVANGA